MIGKHAFRPISHVMEDNDSDLLIAHQAAANGELETLSRVIQSDPALLEHQDLDGVTPLGYAVKAEQLDAVKILVKMGASINTQDNIGRTCLSVAAYQGWYEGVRFLLRNGASQGLCDKTGRSPLHTATYCNDKNVMKLLLQNLGTVNITQTDDEDMTPLHWAAFHGRVSHVELLIERGTDVGLQDIDGKTALHWAAQNGGQECCALLLKADNSQDMVNCRDNSDKTAVHLAAAAGHPAVLTVLAEIEGCQLDAEDADGRFEDNVELIQNVEEVDMLDPDPRHRTPLHWAAAMGRTETLNVLLSFGVDPVPSDLQGHTPLDYARQSGHNDCIDVLERRLGIQKKSAERTLDGRSPKKKNKRRFFTEFFRLKRDGEPSHEQRTPHFPLEGNTSVDDCRRNSEVNIDLISNHRQISLSRKRDHELLESITRLQISRSDNPALGDRPIPTDVRSPPPTDQDQGHFIWNTPSANQDQDYIAQSRTPTNHDQDYFAQSPTLTNQDQSYVVRSPTPAAMFRQDRSLSPGSSPMSLRIEANRAQLEEDAAQILALQLDKGQPQLSPTQGGKSPRPLDPIVSPRGNLTGPDHVTNPSSGSLNSAEVDSRETVPDSKQGILPLAPIRGSLPKVAGPTVNKRLHLLRQEKSGANRSPTPPGWNNTHQNCLSGIRSGDTVDDNEGFPSYSHHKKKKKKPRLLQTRGQQLLTQQTALSLEDPEDRESDNKADDKLEMLTPRLGAGSKVRDAKEQITFNRNVQTLLH